MNVHELAARLIALLEAEALNLGAERDDFAAYTANIYRENVISAAWAYWQEGSRGNYLTRMNVLIKFGLNDAWNAGAASLDILPAEYTAEDKAQIESIITNEKSYVGGLIDYIDLLANTPNASLQKAMPRLEMWARRWQDVYTQAVVWFGGKQKLQWVLGPTEHCRTCSALAGIVAWAEEWDKSGIRPQSHLLECHGFNCQCKLIPTTRRRSPRAFDRILNAVMATRL